jgi:hypothetical protein
MGSRRFAGLPLRWFGAVLVLFALSACEKPATMPAAPSPTPTSVNGASGCDAGPPTPDCASHVASDVGFPVVWMPVPENWQLRQGIKAQPGHQMAAEDVALAGLDIGMVSGDSGDPPAGLHVAGTITWNGSRVTLWRGVPDPNSYPSGFPTPAWVVSARWTHHGHAYNLGILANPELGGTGSPADGLKLLLQVLRHRVRYANP